MAIKVTHGTYFIDIGNTRYPKGVLFVETSGTDVFIGMINRENVDAWIASGDVTEYTNSIDVAFSTTAEFLVYMNSYFNTDAFTVSTDAANAASAAAVLAEQHAQSALREALFRESNVVLFDNDHVSGINAASITGDITFDYTGAIRGRKTYMKHEDGVAPSFPAEAVLLFDTANISTVAANYFTLILVDDTPAAEIVLVSLQQVGV